jgi:hypothetical protein
VIQMSSTALAALKPGDNPFDAATLERLRNE